MVIFFSLVRTLKMAIKKFEVKVDLQKGRGLRFRIFFGKLDVLVSSNSHFHPLLSYGNSP